MLVPTYAVGISARHTADTYSTRNLLEEFENRDSKEARKRLARNILWLVRLAANTLEQACKFG
jgi:hypothetical protein